MSNCDSEKSSCRFKCGTVADKLTDIALDEIRDKKYPAKKHALKVKNHFLSKNKALTPELTAVFIAGEKLEAIKYCDQTKPFRQNRYFFYLSGCNIPGASLLYNLKNDNLTLFLPNVDDDDVMWSGLPTTPGEAEKMFDVDEVLYADEIQAHVGALKGYKVFTTDLDNVADVLREILIEKDEDLFYALNEARMIKDEYEIALIRKACEVTDRCHLAVMSALPIEKNEGHIHAEFTYHAIRQGSKNQGYDPICCAGPNCSTLHYVKNDDTLEGKNSVLIDAGAEWENYTADVTRCFPINGKWTKEHRQIYDIVLDMQSEVMKNIKPGILWDDLHILAHKVLIKHFLELGIFHAKYTPEEILTRKVSVAFFPHGLGHLLGMDTHDVGGLPNYEDSDELLRYLRLRRPLEAGMIVTNEPGCYFNPFLIKELLEKHEERKEVVDFEIMDKYMYIGGVRIEDDVLVTENGHENLTKITSDPDEIKNIVSKGLLAGRKAFHNLI